MRVIIQYITSTLQKRTDRITIPQEQDTDTLIKLVAKKVNAKPNQISLKFKRDGVELRVIKGWPLDHYQIRNNSILQVEQRETQTDINNQYRQKIFQKYQQYGIKDIMPKVQPKLSVLKENTEEEEDEYGEENSENEEKEEQNIGSNNNLNSNNNQSNYSQKSQESFGKPQRLSQISKQKIMDITLEKLLVETKQGNLQNIKDLFEQNFPDIFDDNQLKQVQIQLVNENGYGGWNSLHFAIFQNHLEIVKYLMDRGADVNSVTKDGWTPLQLAVYRKNLSIVEQLLKDEELFVNQVTSRDTALHQACKVQSLEIVKLLMEHDADPDILNDKAESPIDLCQDKEVQEKITKILLKYSEINEQSSPELGSKKQSEQEKLNQQQNQQQMNNHIQQKQQQIIQQQVQQQHQQKSQQHSNSLPVRQARGIATPQRPPIVKGMAYKHGNWTLTLRKRFFVLNPDQGTLVRYKEKKYYPMKPMEVIPLKDIQNVQHIDRSWYMKGNIHYFEFKYNHQVYQMGYTYPETCRSWNFFLKESIRYSSYLEKQIDRTTNEPNQEIELIDNPEIDEQVAKEFKFYLLGKHNSKRPQSPSPPSNNTINQVQQKDQASPTKIRQNSNQAPQAPSLPDKSQELPANISTIRRNQVHQLQTPAQKQQNQQKQQQQNNNNQKNIANKQNSQGSNKSGNSDSTDTENINLGNLQNNNVNFESFKIQKLLGRGAFGKVFLVKKKDDGKIYALKALKKKQLILKKQLKYAVTEANVLKMCNHPFVLKLHYAFQTPNYMYLVLEYCPGGDLSLHLAQRTTFDEYSAKYYTAELILAIEHIHEKDIVYRDLKPENILIDKEGHIKLADFGLSKDGVADADNTRSFCGSPAYLSPEMLTHQGAGKPSDIYGIGCVLYEMITGDPPYYNDDIPKMYANIKNGVLKYPKNITPEAKDLIQKLLDRSPKTRIGVKSKQELKSHPFFKGIDWVKLGNKEIQPPKYDLQLDDDDDDEDDELQYLQPNQPIFQDTDYTENNKRINRVINYTFHRPATAD
ncbi:Protein kinase-like domain [Pseudocohnilembus persalinus]|uniref:non-specific serine/threonine protein kinase n=1 Tax=Pseudocohnilembus persalinus TaxID=266149 RepID=A0A0V0QF51_PSEPJ|nr:Protein kinase-like domain [Pseudocohnilembus persalinus]|eukprot:KRX00795.1 Protein kinase-like domain [Pseudocohnilembus persalinus]